MHQSYCIICGAPVNVLDVNFEQYENATGTKVEFTQLKGSTFHVRTFDRVSPTRSITNQW
jgi:hypothetical protein